MTKEEIRELLLRGERVTLEAKLAERDVPKSVWDTYSAFANNKLYITLVIVSIILAACHSTHKESKETTAAVVEGKTETVVSKRPISDQLYAELDSAEVYNDSILFGYWFKPHEASSVNIFFHKDNTYEFKYYDNDLKDILKKGTFVFDGKVIRLASDSGWDKLFDGILYYKHNGTNFYLTDSDNELILVKGSD